jgi:hypothetical protein
MKSDLKPDLDGLGEKWATHWEREQTYRYDPATPRERVYAIDTPPPTASGALHMGSVFGYVQADIIARYQRMRGMTLFYPMAGMTTACPRNGGCRTISACAVIRRCHTSQGCDRPSTTVRRHRCRAATSPSCVTS